MGRPRGRWEVAVLKGGVDLLQTRHWKAAARLDEVGRGGHCPKIRRSAIVEEAEMWD
jgi:hypothetical protein